MPWINSLTGLSRFLDSLPFDLWSHDLDDRCQFQNATSRRHWGEIVGQRITEAPIEEAVRARWLSTNARARAGEIVKELVDYRTEHVDGRYLAIVAPVVEGDRAVATVGINLDVTEQFRATQARDESDGILRALFSLCRLPVSVRDIRGEQIVHVLDNPVSAGFLRRTPEETRGRSANELGYSPGFEPWAIEVSRRARAKGASESFEFRFPWPDGPRIIHGWVAQVPHPTAERYVVISDDVTQTRHLEASLQQADHLISLGTLAASVGHELRNPLTYVRLNLEMLRVDLDRRGLLSEGTARKNLDMALEGTDRMIQIAGELQDAGRPALDQGSADLNEVVRSVLALAGPEIQSQASVSVQLEPLPRVRGNSLRLGQLLLNLLQNAVRAAGEHGRALGQVWIRTRLGAAGPQLQIQDNGRGIAPEVRDRLFEPFATGYPGRGGTGLGLFVVRQIATAAGATVATSDPSEGGALFTVQFAPEAAPEGPG